MEDQLDGPSRVYFGGCTYEEVLRWSDTVGERGSTIRRGAGTLQVDLRSRSQRGVNRLSVLAKIEVTPFQRADPQDRETGRGLFP